MYRKAEAVRLRILNTMGWATVVAKIDGQLSFIKFIHMQQAQAFLCTLLALFKERSRASQVLPVQRVANLHSAALHFLTFVELLDVPTDNPVAPRQFLAVGCTRQRLLFQFFRGLQRDAGALSYPLAMVIGSCGVQHARPYTYGHPGRTELK